VTLQQTRDWNLLVQGGLWMVIVKRIMNGAGTQDKNKCAVDRLNGIHLERKAALCG